MQTVLFIPKTPTVSFYEEDFFGTPEEGHVHITQLLRIDTFTVGFQALKVGRGTLGMCFQALKVGRGL